jgi:hypothetical protein
VNVTVRFTGSSSDRPEFRQRMDSLNVTLSALG